MQQLKPLGIQVVLGQVKRRVISEMAILTSCDVAISIRQLSACLESRLRCCSPYQVRFSRSQPGRAEASTRQSEEPHCKHWLKQRKTPCRGLQCGFCLRKNRSVEETSTRTTSHSPDTLLASSPQPQKLAPRATGTLVSTTCVLLGRFG